ncbi:hypothetical protein BDR03DRAFT_951833 [Suillus americanus]|nr:hypothetical protein BDR03DRAFT_951833 [Suillus americanus]
MFTFIIGSRGDKTWFGVLKLVILTLFQLSAETFIHPFVPVHFMWRSTSSNLTIQVYYPHHIRKNLYDMSNILGSTSQRIPL